MLSFLLNLLYESTLALTLENFWQPDVYSFNTLLSACACAAAEGRKAPKRGLRALELMQEANVPPSGMLKCVCACVRACVCTHTHTHAHALSAEAFNQLLQACTLAEEAGAQGGIEIGLRVRALMWSYKANGNDDDDDVNDDDDDAAHVAAHVGSLAQSFVDSFVTPRQADDAEVLIEVSIIDRGFYRLRFL